MSSESVLVQIGSLFGRSIGAIVLLLTSLGTASASEPACAPERMQRLVTSFGAGDFDQNDFASKPRTLYRYTEKYGRLEEAADPAAKLHQLFVVSEPDIWMVNLVDSKGLHVVDGGPDLHFVAPVLQMAELDGWEGFEFGCEVEFMVAAGVSPVPLGPRGRLMYSHRVDGISVELYVGAQGSPSKVDVKLPDSTFSVIYHLYEADLEPDLSLFEKPGGIEFEEQ